MVARFARCATKGRAPVSAHAGALASEMGITAANRRLPTWASRSRPGIPGMRSGTPRRVAADEPTIMRVRSHRFQAIATLIDLAATRSLTFRNLVSLIQASNGMVYVEPGECGHGTRACLKVWMQASGSTRFLRVVVSRRRAQLRRGLHELDRARTAAQRGGLERTDYGEQREAVQLLHRGPRFHGNNRFETSGDQSRRRRSRELGDLRVR